MGYNILSMSPLAVDKKENVMKKLSQCIVTFIILLISATCLIIPDSKAQTEVDVSGPTIRAVKGDTLWILLNHVKHNKRQQFEKFIHETFWPKATKLKSNEGLLILYSKYKLSYFFFFSIFRMPDELKIELGNQFV